MLMLSKIHTSVVFSIFCLSNSQTQQKQRLYICSPFLTLQPTDRARGETSGI